VTATEPSGRDLARQIFQQARAAAKNTPTRPGTGRPRRRAAPARGAGRDPVGLGAVVAGLMADEGVDVALGGGTVLDQWETIAPELAGKVAAEHFAPETGLLSLRPATAAYGTQLRMLQAQMVARINTKLGRAVVRSLRVLPPGNPQAAQPGGTRSVAAQSAAAPGTPGAPLRTRADASPGLLAALAVAAAHHDQTPRTPRPTSPLADAPVLREPEHAFVDAVQIQEDLAAAAARTADIERRARAMARAQKAGRTLDVPRVFDQAG
jgi:predicted nucleic acid-binding Zn ribbon protein